MKLTIFLTAVSLICFGCAKGGGGGSPSPAAAIVTDYSKVLCGNVTECNYACFIHYPAGDNAGVASLCTDVGLSTNSPTCAALVDFNNINYQPQLSACALFHVTDMIDPAIIGTAKCGTSAACVAKCNALFPYLSEQSLIDTAAANHVDVVTTLSVIYQNSLVAFQNLSCIQAPISYVTK